MDDNDYARDKDETVTDLAASFYRFLSGQRDAELARRQITAAPWLAENGDNLRELGLTDEQIEQSKKDREQGDS